MNHKNIRQAIEALQSEPVGSHNRSLTDIIARPKNGKVLRDALKVQDAFQANGLPRKTECEVLANYLGLRADVTLSIFQASRSTAIERLEGLIYQNTWIIGHQSKSIDDLAQAMKDKMEACTNAGKQGWDTCPTPHLQGLLAEAILKGDPVDVANYAMMLHSRKAKTSCRLGRAEVYHEGTRSYYDAILLRQLPGPVRPPQKPWDPQPMENQDLTLKDMQVQLPWTIHYAKDFRASPMAHKDFGHALLHVTKACGKLAAAINDAEHGGHEFDSPSVDPYIADLVVCALRMANTVPGRTMDLQKAVEDRIEGKNGVKMNRKKVPVAWVKELATQLIKIYDRQPHGGGPLNQAVDNLRKAL